MACFRVVPVMALLAGCLLSACASQSTQLSADEYAPPPQLPPATPETIAIGPAITGIASWYEPGRGLHRTCDGQIFTGNGMTAASHSIPLGTRVLVALLGNAKRSVIVRVNDCMPREGRVLDLSRAAAQQLGIIAAGVAQVRVTPVVMVADNH